ncbi:MAG: PAS domain S-box protein [Bacteroidota bacterium]|nr:PAS domain S-box protein [Bacteroidota bacterium]
MAKKHSSAKITEKIHPPTEQSRLALLSVIEDQRLAQQALQASELRYKNLLETAQDIVFTISPEGVITMLNAAFETVTGWSRFEWLGKNMGEGIVHSDDWQLAVETVRRTARGTIPPITEVRIKTKSGEYRLGEFILSPQIYEGTVTEILGIGRDVTQRKQAEELLRENEEKFQQSFEYAAAGMCIVGLDAKFQRVNNTFKEMMGYNEDEITHFTIAEITHPDDVSITVSNIKKMLAGEITHTSFEKRYIRKDKTILWAYVSTSLVLNANHQPNFFITQIIDITERKQIQETLAESEEKYRTFIENSLDAILLTAPDGNIFSVNPAACKMFGRTEAELCSMGRESLVDSNDPRLNVLLAERAKTGKAFGELTMFKKNGVPFPVEISSALFYDKNGNVRTSMIIRDITGRKKTEEQIRFQALLLDQVANGVASTDLEGHLLYWNKYAETLHGWTMEELQGQNIFETLLPPDQRELVTSIVASAMQHGHGEGEFMMNRKDGTQFPAHVGYNVAYDSKGKIIGIVGASVDLTDIKKAEETLRHREAYLTALIENQPGLVWLKDVESCFLAVNHKFATACGKQSPGDVVGKFDVDIWPKELAAKYSAEDVQVMQTKQSISMEEILNDQGVDKWFDTFKTAVADEHGNIIGITGYSYDITHRKQLEDELRLSEEKFSRLFNLSPDAMNLCTLPDGKYIAVNQKFSELSGYTFEEVIDKSSHELGFWIHPEQRDEFGKMLGSQHGSATIETQLKMKGEKIIDAMMAGKIIEIHEIPYLLVITKDITKQKQDQKEISMLAQTIKGITECVTITDVNDNVLFVNRAFENTYGYSADELIGKQIEVVHSPKTPAGIWNEILPAALAGGWKGELWNKKKDGAEFPVHLSTSAVKDQQGNVTALVGIAEDISKQKIAQQELNILNLALQSAANSIVITDREGAILAVNPAFSKVTGYASEEVIGKKSSILKSGKQSSEFYKNLWETILAGNVWKGEIINKNKDNKEYTEEMTITPVQNSAGEITQFIAIKQDITEQKSLQIQFSHMQKMESIGTLASGIAHDFNNILGIILAHVYILGKGKTDPEKYKTGIQTIQDSVKRGASLVKQILTFARQAETTFTQLNIPDLVREIASMLHETFSTIISIQIDIGLNIPSINADHTQIHQALLNLCVNARDAMPKGGTITIRVETVTHSAVAVHFPNVHSDEYVCVSVSDTGTGMDKETEARIFDPFFTTKEKGKGTGLGLSVVFGVMQSHSGFVRVSSTVGVGTTFYLYVPVKTTTVGNGTIKESKKITGYVRGNETILLVEDEESLRNIVASLMESCGYTVLIAEDGLEAVQIYKKRQQEIALVLTDIGLPKLSGIDEFKQLKEINPEVRVVLASGFFEPDIKSELYKAGAKGFIQKPYDMDEILSKVREALDT